MSICNLQEVDARNMLCATAPAPQFRTNFFVEAGAGAGKTYIIVNRIVNQLLSGTCTPEQIVAISFTVKSTEELRHRLDVELLARHSDALAKSDAKKAAQIKAIHAKLGRMQVSTIHNFCQTMLQTMPFEADLGMEIEVVEDDTPYIEAFYQRKLKKEPSQFAGIRALGIDPVWLSQSFAALCGAGDSKIAYAPPTSSEIKAVSSSLYQLCGMVHAELRGIFIMGSVTYKKARTPIKAILDANGNILHPDVQMLSPEMLAFLKNPAPQGMFLISSVAQFLREPYCPLRPYGDDVREMRKNLTLKQSDLPVGYASAHPLFEIMKMLEGYKCYKTTKVLGTCRQIKPLLENLTHSIVLTQFLPWIDEYRDEKAAAHRLDFNDLLLLARNMLRDSAVARQYFHQQYRTIYVDEFQDTDPVQVSLLFYLTDTSNHLASCVAQGTAPNWQKCTPRGGSLFLVGDPKQAIYRFRGADIESYNQVKDLFIGSGNTSQGIGQVVLLQNNYRSDAVICGFVDKAFSPQSSTKGTAFFTPSTCQAGYSAMHAVRGVTKLGEVSHYCILGDNAAEIKQIDATFVADSIADMVENKVQVNGKTAPHAAQYQDFLVLTYGRADVERYVAALAAKGIPCASSGDRHLNDAQPIQRGLAHLDVLAHPNNGAKLVALLQNDYGIALPTIHRFLVHAGGALVHALYSTNAIAQVRAQLAKAAPDPALTQLCDAAQKLAQLMQRAKTQPPMAVVEYLFDGGFELWQNADLRTQREEYAMVQQFLNGVRHGAVGSLPDYYAFAAAYATKGVEYQLLLEAAVDCVRVMNLHKAKGLEGNVVFLTYSGEAKQKATQHVMRQNGQSTLYHCLTKRYQGAGGFTTTMVYGTPLEWEDSAAGAPQTIGKKTIEEQYLAAEALRLNYVAATRAETKLMISGGQKMKRGKNASAGLVISTRWDNLYAQCLHPRNAKFYLNLLAAAPPAVIAAPQMPTVIAPGVFATAAPPAPQAAQTVLPDLWAKECALCEVAAACKTPVYYAVSPSKLDHAAPRLQKTEELPVAEAVQDAVSQAGQVSTATSASAQTQPATTAGFGAASKAQAPAATAADPAAPHSPYGPDWGSIVHRVMELSALAHCCDAATLKQYAQQAIAEILPSPPATLTAQQATCLFGAAGMSGASLTPARATWLCAQVASALGFASALFAKLRQGGTIYPELSFFASVKKGDLYDHLKAHLQGQARKDNAFATVQQFDVQGYIDLAVLSEKGWIVIDYKTDRQRQGEPEAQYRARLAEEYRNQVSAYGLLLAQATGKPVVRCALCAIPLGGDMIAL